MPEQNSQAPSSPPQLHEAPLKPLASAVWGDVLTGLGHFRGEQQPAPRHPVRQFFHGLSLPFHLGRAVWGNPSARWRYLRVAVVQAAIILGVALYLERPASDAVDTVQGEEARAERLQERARAKQKVKHTVESIAQAFAPNEEAKERISIKLGDDDDDDDDKEELPATTPQLEAPAKAKGFLAHALSVWGALFATMQVVQWVVIALSRDFHDAISRDASLLTGLEPEDEAKRARIRLDTKWLRNKFVRRFRAFKVFALGLPLIYLATSVAPFHHELASVLVSLWGAYWLVVFTTSKSAHAWKNAEPKEPWFLRGWSWLTAKVPGFRWRLPRAYGRVWSQQTQALFSPAAEMEQQPWAFAGLAVVRTLSIIPLVKCFLRPLIPVAAAHLLVSQQGVQRAPAPVPAAPPAAAESSSANAA